MILHSTIVIKDYMEMTFHILLHSRLATVQVNKLYFAYRLSFERRFSRCINRNFSNYCIIVTKKRQCLMKKSIINLHNIKYVYVIKRKKNLGFNFALKSSTSKEVINELLVYRIIIHHHLRGSMTICRRSLCLVNLDREKKILSLLLGHVSYSLSPCN
jgi:hypothetical protein